MTIEEVNACSGAEFVEKLGWIFEDSPWVAERTWTHRPFASLTTLHAAMTAAMGAATRDEQLALLRAHPELGSRAPMGEASAQEQQGAGLGWLDPDHREFLRRYRELFGFPFLYAVKGSTVEDIFMALMIRLDSTPEEEFNQALREVSRIAWFRLQDEFKES